MGRLQYTALLLEVESLETKGMPVSELWIQISRRDSKDNLEYRKVGTRNTTFLEKHRKGVMRV